jgi:hypothetical protein
MTGEHRLGFHERASNRSFQAHQLHSLLCDVLGG